MRDKIPTLLIPGSLCDESLWAPQVAALSDAAHARVCAWPAGLDSVPAMAEAILAGASASPFVLVGFSLGGFIALEMMRREPERILGLALLDTSARPDDPANRPVRAANLARFVLEPDAVLEQFAALLCGPETPAPVAAAVRGTIRRLGPARYPAEQHAIMTRPDARQTLGSIRCPTLVLCGTEDRATPPAVNREIAAGINGSRYVELAGVGHITTLSAPEAVSHAVGNLISRVANG